MPGKISRRRFMGQVLGLSALSATVPSFLQKTGVALAADGRKVAPIPGLKDSRVLVVVQMAGGNDGLNTVIPYGDDLYYTARPKLGIEAGKVLKLDTHLGLHPEMVELKRLFDDGSLAILQNVGYPNPERSHFRSTDIWETASPSDKVWQTGWVGRYFDANCAGCRSTTLGFQVGSRPALTFSSARSRVVTIENPGILDFSTERAIADGLKRVNRVEPTGIGHLDYIQRTANDTLGLSRTLQQALAGGKSSVEYAPFNFSQSLKIVAQMIVAELPVRVFYVSHGSFDTHNKQAGPHAALLQEFSEGLGAFCANLKATGHFDRTLIMTFSEFGRRVAQNESGGTDHGTASVMFLMGGAVKPGMHGSPPDLKTLDEGDLIHRVDFRSVYATVLGGWLGADPKPILEGAFPPVPLLKGGGKSA